ncbi:MAG TPA: hypothetical protein VII99_07160 [Bacteroidia bacterium]
MEKRLDETEKINRLREIRSLIEEDCAGLNTEGRIVDIRKYPEAEHISSASPQARQIVFVASVIAANE